ncbi:hypothetical protein [Shewanella gelidii]|uniref:Uncharacterized protein n=1 Tax=Shewanella gelidii TaxID=1642821 RepID=A0A917N7X1_9GAMM|nr:hypothetical protein [Shewanella gelidii]MCL1097426.1 hypothetical protein [Shewanella gelidii]GGI75052.1 hypothetical protein GCM10009332_10680 [Shewanella gelidii]
MRLILLLLLLISSPAFAFSQQGNTATLMLFVGLGGFTTANLLLQLAFYLSGRLQHPTFLRRYVNLSLIPSGLMLLIALWDFAGFGPLMMNLGGILIAAAFALIPYQLVQLKQISSQRPWLLSAAAATFAAIGAFLAPVNLFAIACGHVALQQQSKLKIIDGAIVLISYGVLGYWIWQTAQSWI